MRMKRIMSIILLLVPFLVISCEERTPDLFADINGVYFNNSSGTSVITDSLDLTFVYESGDEMEVPVKVQLVGRPSDDDRPLRITVSSSDAVEGVDFIVPSYPVMPAGASSTDYVVVLKRTPALKKTAKTITLNIFDNECFALPVTEMITVSDTVSTLAFTITYSDMFTKAPSAWDSNLVGEFTQQKFELICKVLDIDPADFNDPSLVTLARLLYISAEMTAYVDGETAKKNAGEPYDADAFDYETGEPLTFR